MVSESGTSTDGATGAALQEGATTPKGRMSRRALLGRGTGVLGVGALATSGTGRLLLGEGRPGGPRQDRVAASAPRAVAAAATAPPRYRTAPGLVPPILQVSEPRTPTTAGLVLLTPSMLSGAKGSSPAESVAAGDGQAGLLITDLRGEPIWFEPTTESPTNLQVQIYEGKPVLTFWTGKIVDGIGYGTGHVLDTSYRPVATIHAVNGLQEDLHELTLTPQGTALITAYRQTKADTSAIGGSKNGAVYEGVVQEIELSSGKALFEWSSLAHVPVSDSYVKASGSAPIDYFHINSISLWDQTSLLISSRHTWTVYCVSRKNGAVLWRLGGKRSSFAMGPGTVFEWQHHSRRLGSSQQLSIFDDGTNGIAPGGEPRSRAIIVTLDTRAHRATLARAVTHPAGLLAPYEGSVQLLDDGHLFVGWGGEPYSSEFDGEGRLVLDLRFPTKDQSYRAFRSPWHATPMTPPAVVVEQDGVNGLAVYVSWNGATEVAQWQVLTGSSASSLAPVATVPTAGFETAITVHPSGAYLAVAGLDAAGRRLGISKTEKV